VLHSPSQRGSGCGSNGDASAGSCSSVKGVVIRPRPPSRRLIAGGTGLRRLASPDSGRFLRPVPLALDQASIGALVSPEDGGLGARSEP
jgi:hypothetical protein